MPPKSMDRTLPLSRLFEAQVARTPHETAVILQDQSLTFAALNAASNRLARRLQSLGVVRESLVGVYLPRCLDSLVALLGILKAGGAYVPLDTSDPPARTLSLIGDAGLSVVVSDARVSRAVKASSASVLELDTDAAAFAAESAENLPEAAEPQDLAYVLYTSGTTGRPKGVMIEQHSVVHLIDALEEAVYAHIPGADRVSVTASLSFDASVKQIFQLLKGRTLVIVPEEARRDGGKLLLYIATQQIDVVDCTPSLLEILLIAGLRGAGYTHRPAFLIGGEAIGQTLWTELQGLKEYGIFNLYGPTECTVDATAAVIGVPSARSNVAEGASSAEAPSLREGAAEARREAPSVPTIGLPLPGITTKIVDSLLRPVPDGTAGELMIGGPGVARGYLNSLELTAEKFIADSGGTRFYRSGDRVRRTSDGWLQYIGRTDDQVKVRGYRIELAEIENALGAHPAVRSAAVTVLPSGNLAAFVVPVADSSLENTTESVVDRSLSDALREYIVRLLPDYMVPSAYVMLSEFPLTENGKVDKRLLPVPPAAVPARSGQAAATDDVLELLLISHWEEVLGAEGVGPSDDFFELGGSSIAATQMISNLQSFFPTDDPLLSLFFEDPTPAGLARGIREFKEDGCDPDNVARILLDASHLTDEEMEAMLAGE